MKKRVFLALLAAAAVTFVGCSKDDDGPDEGPQTYTITFEGDDWSPLVVANYNGGKAMSVVYEDKAYTWTDQTTQLTSPCPEGWGYPFMVSSYNSKDIEKFNSYELDLYLYNARNEDATTGGGHDGSDNFLIGYGNYDEAHPDYGDSRPIFAFADGVARTIQSCYINSTCYFLSVAAKGNALAPALEEGQDVLIHGLGRGLVEGEYIFDPERGQYANTRKVRWTDKGEWELSDQGAIKTLTDITSYTDYVKKLQNMIDGDKHEDTFDDAADEEITFEPYTADDFLTDVYMDEDRYKVLKSLLLTKKNVILQGAPGVGKTFAAKRLAFSIMGEKDTNRVKMVQFHQSYSYEDFIMGFRPTETGFELRKGVFYEFCRQAAEDDRPYFFIIDEINRGNLSKIFGELFMLIESDKRGVELQLLYADEQFSIPSNVYIIGMMNTADRSLAMLDYALRRRFAFFELTPAFSSAGFRAYRTKVNNPKFDRLIATVEQLNDVIANDDSLGEGFCIGHSYFCTNATINDEWMRSVVEYELIPLLKEYWFDEAVKVKDWSRTLREVVK